MDGFSGMGQPHVTIETALPVRDKKMGITAGTAISLHKKGINETHPFFS
jgi:hypothetical protein